MIPVVVLVAVTAVLCFGIYSRMIRTEDEICWARLENATNSTAQKVQTRIGDNLHFLESVSDAYIFTHNIDDLEAVGAYLDSVVEKTSFQRVDVLCRMYRFVIRGNGIGMSAEFQKNMYNAFEEDKQKCLDVGMDGHIEKPIHARTVLKELTHVLAK